MSDLIWMGNTLMPRDLVYGAVVLLAVILIAGFTVLTDDR